MTDLRRGWGRGALLGSDRAVRVGTPISLEGEQRLPVLRGEAEIDLGGDDLVATILVIHYG